MFDRNRPYEPLTSDNATLVLVDHQVGLMTGVRDMSISELKHNVIGLAKAAKALELPIVVTTTARDSTGRKKVVYQRGPTDEYRPATPSPIPSGW
jgi:nicotinamidase-related amidase